MSHTRFTHNMKVTISCGVAVSPPGEIFDYGELFDRADTALYEAKHGGRNRVNSAHVEDDPCEPVLAEVPDEDGGSTNGEAELLTAVSGGDKTKA